MMEWIITYLGAAALAAGIVRAVSRMEGRSKSTVRRWRQKSCLPAQEHEGTT